LEYSIATADEATFAKQNMPSPLRVPISIRDLPTKSCASAVCTACGERIGDESTGDGTMSEQLVANAAAVTAVAGKSTSAHAMRAVGKQSTRTGWSSNERYRFDDRFCGAISSVPYVLGEPATIRSEKWVAREKLNSLGND
jgi:hypothetical protein